VLGVLKQPHLNSGARRLKKTKVMKLILACKSRTIFRSEDFQKIARNIAHTSRAMTALIGACGIADFLAFDLLLSTKKSCEFIVSEEHTTFG